MIFSLIRASQVENWKVANGKINKAPPPPADLGKVPVPREILRRDKNDKAFSGEQARVPTT